MTLARSPHCRVTKGLPCFSPGFFGQCCSVILGLAEKSRPLRHFQVGQPLFDVMFKEKTLRPPDSLSQPGFFPSVMFALRGNLYVPKTPSLFPYQARISFVSQFPLVPPPRNLTDEVFSRPQGLRVLFSLAYWRINVPV